MKLRTLAIMFLVGMLCGIAQGAWIDRTFFAKLAIARIEVRNQDLSRELYELRGRLKQVEELAQARLETWREANATLAQQLHDANERAAIGVEESIDELIMDESAELDIPVSPERNYRMCIAAARAQDRDNPSGECLSRGTELGTGESFLAFAEHLGQPWK